MEELIESLHIGVNDLMVLGHRLILGEEPTKHRTQMIRGERHARGGRAQLLSLRVSVTGTSGELPQSDPMRWVRQLIARI